MSEYAKFRGKPLGSHVYTVEIVPPATPEAFGQWTDKKLLDHRLASHPENPTRQDERVILRGMCSGRTGEQLREAEREMPGVTVFVAPRNSPEASWRTHPLPDNGT